MPHLHLSLQSGDDLILKRMKRRHLRAPTRSRFATTVRRLRPDVVFGADLIAGFPTETEAMFQNSLDLVEACGLTHLHVFPFSPRPGRRRRGCRNSTAPSSRSGRGGCANAARWRLHRHLDGEVGATRRVLAESRGIGRTEQFTPVQLARAGRARTDRSI